MIHLAEIPTRNFNFATSPRETLYRLRETLENSHSRYSVLEDLSDDSLWICHLINRETGREVHIGSDSRIYYAVKSDLILDY